MHALSFSYTHGAHTLTSLNKDGQDNPKFYFVMEWAQNECTGKAETILIYDETSLFLVLSLSIGFRDMERPRSHVLKWHPMPTNDAT